MGDALIPEGVGELTEDLFLPGGTQIGRELSLPDQEDPGLIIPPTSTLSTMTFSPSNLPARTLLLGYSEPTESELVIPAGSEFLSGYQLPDGEIVQAGTADAETTFPAGTLLFGGIALPGDDSGEYLTFSDDLILAGAVMVPATADGVAISQGPEGITIPVIWSCLPGHRELFWRRDLVRVGLGLQLEACS
jgi:hypothetical protein